ncbi:MAG: thiol-disulfide isomerase/thioredoxin [Verrucomicrobiales bacterium]|jgi:thiol-disulfide isomerase/thioredoxin
MAKKSGGSKKAAQSKKAPQPKQTPALKKKKGLSAGAQWSIIVGIGVLIVGAIVFSGIQDAADDGGEGVVARESFDLPDLTDDENPDSRIRLADFEGTPTVVNFFASWCTACDSELPAFRDTALSLDGEVDFIFVNSNESGNWKPMVERNDIEQFTLAKDIQGISRNGLYRELGGTSGMPITAFYDADGNLVDTAFTAFNESSLDGRLRSLGLLS